MFLNYNSENLQKEEFEGELRWFEAEFDAIFQNKSVKLTEYEKNLANSLLNKLSES